jgi:hypothetical protein
MVFYDGWRVKSTVNWTSFFISLAVAAAISVFITVALKVSGNVEIVVFVTIFWVIFLIIFNQIKKNWFKKLLEKNWLILKDDPGIMVYCLPSAQEKAGAVEWRTPADEVVFRDLAANLGSFQREGMITSVIEPFSGVNFCVTFEYELKSGVDPETLLVVYHDEPGLEDFLQEAGKEALQKMVKKFFSSQDEKIIFNHPASSVSLKVVLECIFQQNIEEVIGQAHVRVSPFNEFSWSGKKISWGGSDKTC